MKTGSAYLDIFIVIGLWAARGAATLGCSAEIRLGASSPLN
jgi:hypothetical protein